MTRTASAIWHGDLKSGNGTVGTASGVLSETPYSFNTRFGEGVTGSNPEELIAAAHAACFSMAFANELTSAGHPAEAVETSAAVTMKDLALTTSALTVTARVPGADEATVREIGEKAKVGCPISRALSTLEITLDLTVVV